jgi:hypothetical protein
MSEEIDNLLLNMISGLLPKDLSPEEVGLLENNFGENRFEELGYDENYEKPIKKRNRNGYL